LAAIEANAFFNIVEVPDVDQYVARVKIAGGKTLSPKFSIPGTGYLVPCMDTEGNYFGIIQPDKRVS
jgi:predicted enzyme related to lactoylglutathione lyase